MCELIRDFKRAIARGLVARGTRGTLQSPACCELPMKPVKQDEDSPMHPRRLDQVYGNLGGGEHNNAPSGIQGLIGQGWRGGRGGGGILFGRCGWWRRRRHGRNSGERFCGRPGENDAQTMYRGERNVNRDRRGGPGVGPRDPASVPGKGKSPERKLLTPTGAKPDLQNY